MCYIGTVNPCRHTENRQRQKDDFFGGGSPGGDPMNEGLIEMQNFWNRLRSGITALNQRRDRNTERYAVTNFLLTALFPLFIVCMAELNQDKYPSKFILFCAERPSVMIFNVLIAALIFGVLLLLFKRGWRAMAVQSFVYMLLSVIELFKFGTNGNHLLLSDMKLANSIKSISSFAYIQITPQLITYLLLVAAYVGAAFWFNPRQRMKLSRRLISAGACLATFAAIVAVPGVSSTVYGLFDVDTSEADNTFQLNEKFDNNSFLAFFVQTTSEGLANRLREPEGYDEDAIQTMLNVDVDSTAQEGKVQPNVIVVMSEAFADFRPFAKELGIQTNAYRQFDAVAAEGWRGTAVVPTFASFTVRTEFELMFGLPVRSLNDPNMPQQLMEDRPQPTLARYYKENGYSTAYVHPFLSTFYNREEVYSNFGFDTMVFEDDFTVDVNYYGAYIDDATVFNQILQLVQDTDQPLYLHTTTMQNHQPYDKGKDPEAEFDNYLTWISRTGDSLRAFTNALKKLDEPTIVLFVGDHFPSLKGEDSVYDALGMNGDNCRVLYEQSYFIWSNYQLDYSAVPDTELSAFYLPYVVMDLAQLPRDSYLQRMHDKMQTLPVYATNYDPEAPRDSMLDMLTYDRICGEDLSGAELIEKTEPEIED